MYYFISVSFVAFIGLFFNSVHSFYRMPTLMPPLAVVGIVGYLVVKRRANVGLQFLIVSSIACIAFFLMRYGFTPINSDDHPTFRFRLELLIEHFPNIPIYFPYWNFGIDQRDFFASGSLAFFFLSWPILKLFGVETGYNLAVAQMLFVINPACAYFAARLSGARRTAPLAGILSLNVSLLFFQWSFGYGTMGFVTSLALYPLSFAFLRLLFSGKTGHRNWYWHSFGGLVVAINLIWPLTGFALLPSIFYLKKRFFRLQSMVTAALIAFSCLLWVPLFFKVSRVSSFVGNSAHFSHMGTVNRYGVFSLYGVTEHIVHKALEFLQAGNPLVMISVSLLLLKRNLVTFYLLFVGLVVSYYKPQLELSRMLLFLGSLAMTYFTLSLGRLSVIPARGKINYFWTRVLVVTLLIFTPISALRIVDGKSLVSPIPLDDGLVAIKDYLGTNGRNGNVMFTGVVVHHYGGGHIAPWALEMKKRMLASSFVHNKWDDFDIVPEKVFKRGTSSIERFFDLQDVSTIVTHVVRWHEYLESHPDYYQLVLDKEIHQRRIKVYERRKFAESYVALGQVKNVEFTSNAINLMPDSEDIVIKSSYFPFLHVDGCQAIAAHRVAGIRNPVIKLSGCKPGSRVQIKSISSFERLFL